MAEPHVWFEWLNAFCFGYPFVMSWYWLAGGILYWFLRERHEPPMSEPPPLASHPPVSILVPCHNEEARVEETLALLELTNYPDFEIVAIDDGSLDGTGALLRRLAAASSRLRVVHLSLNQGKSTALNAGALAARHEYLVCIDCDALLDPHAVSWFMHYFLRDGRLGAQTGNPRIRNRTTMLGKVQVGEFSSIIGLIKRAQTIYGRLFTVSGVVCAFRKRALQEAGWWTREAITDDVDATWKVQLAGWRVSFASKALCWILMPETLKGLWHQRLRWSQGGTETLFRVSREMFRLRLWRMLPIWLNYWTGLFWAYAMVAGILIRLVTVLHPAWSAQWAGFSIFPDWSGAVLAFTYVAQASISLSLERHIDKDMGGALFWQVWYPLLFWMMQTATAVVALPRAVRRPRRERGVWISPDRGLP